MLKVIAWSVSRLFPGGLSVGVPRTKGISHPAGTERRLRLPPHCVATVRVYLDDMELTNALSLSTSNFLSVLEAVSAGDLSLPTPCEGWSVSELLNHVARGSDMAVALVQGATKEEASAMFEADPPSDVIEACRRALAEQLEVLGAITEPEGIVHHPMGDMATSQLFDFRIGDLTLHAWDLARSIAIAEELPADLVEHVYNMLLPLEAVLGSIGVFGEGPSGKLHPEASAQTKLLDLSGRRP